MYSVHGIPPEIFQDSLNEALREIMTKDWLVWSYEHRAWWKPGDMGYTTDIKQAGRFTQAEAVGRSLTKDEDGNPHEVPVGPDLLSALSN